jgi:hypothetical protein
VEGHLNDQHVVVRIPIRDHKNFLRIFLADDFSIGDDSILPPLGSASVGLRIISEKWSPSKDLLVLDVSGKAGKSYDLKVLGGDQIDKIDGAVGTGMNDSRTTGVNFIEIDMPQSNSEAYTQKTIVFHFNAKPSNK